MPEPGPAPSTARRPALAERLARLPLFVAADYLAAYPDIAAAGFDPLVHAAAHGLPEGRSVVSAIAAARAYGRAAEGAGAPWHAGPPARTARRRCTVFVHSLSDEGHHAFAAALAADLAAAGFPAALADERADHRAHHGTALFVAAHDFFALGRGPLWRDPEILGRGFVVMDDALGTPAWDGALGAALEARGVVDTSAVGPAVWTEAGIPNARLAPRAPIRARWLDPSDLDHPLMHGAPAGARRAGCDPLGTADRPLDVLVFAPEAERRNAALGRLAPSLARHRNYVYLQQPAHTRAEEHVYRRAHWRIAGHLAAHSRLTLSLSAGVLPVLDRRGVVEQAMAAGSVVVSDARFVEPGLEAGLHYLSEDARHLADLLDWALLDPDGRAAVERVRERAFARVAALNGDPRRFDPVRDFLLAEAPEGDER